MTLDATPDLFRELLRAVPDGLLVVDAEGRIVLTNDQVGTIFGYGPDDLIGRPVEVLVPDDTTTAHLEHRSSYHDSPRVRAMGVAQKLSGRRADGSLFPVEVSLSPTTLDSGESVVIATVRDVSERAAAEEALASAQRRGLLLADRERLARDLHDTVIQQLFATGMHLQATLPLIGASEGADRVSDAVDAIDDTIKHVRETIFGLTTKRSQLRERVEQVVRSFDGVLPSPATITLSGDLGGIDNEVVEHLVPTLREALSNVAKHAKAHVTRVVVTVVDEALHLEVRDDGVGVTPEALETRTGHGVTNLEERAVALGGKFELTESPGGGSALVWQVPLSN